MKTPAPVATLQAIPPGREGVRATLKLMARLARDGSTTLPVRLAALQIVQGLPQRDRPAEVSALHQFVRDHIRYVRDPVGVETLHAPEQVLALKQGDCDDKSILLASLLDAIGHPARYHAVGFRPGVFQHVYVEARIGGRWVALETTEPRPMGWAPPGVVEHMILNVQR